MCLYLLIENKTKRRDLAADGTRSLARGGDTALYTAYSTGRDLSRYGGGGGGAARGSVGAYYAGGGTGGSPSDVGVWILVGFVCTCYGLLLLFYLILFIIWYRECYAINMSNNPSGGLIELGCFGERQRRREAEEIRLETESKHEFEKICRESKSVNEGRRREREAREEAQRKD